MIKASLFLVGSLQLLYKLSSNLRLLFKRSSHLLMWSPPIPTNCFVILAASPPLSLWFCRSLETLSISFWVDPKASSRIVMTWNKGGESPQRRHLSAQVWLVFRDAATACDVVAHIVCSKVLFSVPLEFRQCRLFSGIMSDTVRSEGFVAPDWRK